MATTSNFSKILYDQRSNAPIKMNRNMTIEEYLDLLHHSHQGLDKIDSMISRITILETKIAELESIILNSDSASESVVNALSNKVDNLQSKVTEIDSELDSYVDEDIQIGDWDATTPEVDSKPL